MNEKKNNVVISSKVCRANKTLAYYPVVYTKNLLYLESRGNLGWDLPNKSNLHENTVAICCLPREIAPHF